ncbi:MAG: CRTAC1 family protein [Pseudolabrys sp.]|nr:CRTAC1 family protein [Pseudolabrys sp.]
MTRFLRRHAAKLATVSIAAAFYALALPHDLSAAGRAALAAKLRFAPTYLEPADNGQPMRKVRTVNPALQHYDAWISSVGAGAALADIAGSGKPADICLVDPRNDSVSVMPAPDTGARFAPFALPTPADGYEARTIAPMGCLPADVNEDGRMDLVVYYWGRTPVVFLRNDAAELTADAFTPVEVVPQREVWNTNAAIVADIDGDGHPDLMFGNYFRDGDRILDPAATAGVKMQHSMSRAENGGRNRLLLWQSATRTAIAYRDASEALTPAMADGWTLALGARDLTGDLLPEIYVANDFGSDRLLLNESTPGQPKFRIVERKRDVTTPRSKVLGRDSFKGMGVDFGDVSGDGRPAIAVSNIASPYALLESHFLFVNTGDAAAWARGQAPYRDESFARGTWISNWGWDIKFADVLNSGRPALVQTIGFIKGEHDAWPRLQELAMGNDELLPHPAAWPRFRGGEDLSGHDHDRLFLPDADGRYHDVWPLLGLDRDTISRGVATADVYGDGRLAVLIARQWQPSLYLRNVSEGGGRAIVIDLRVAGLGGATRAAYGAEARVTLDDGRIVTSTVDGGSGHGGRRAPEIHLGLGDVAAGRVFDVEIDWRDAQGPHRTTFKLKPGRHRIVLSAQGA